MLVIGCENAAKTSFSCPCCCRSFIIRSLSCTAAGIFDSLAVLLVVEVVLLVIMFPPVPPRGCSAMLSAVTSIRGFCSCCSSAGQNPSPNFRVPAFKTCPEVTTTPVLVPPPPRGPPPRLEGERLGLAPLVPQELLGAASLLLCCWRSIALPPFFEFDDIEGTTLSSMMSLLPFRTSIPGSRASSLFMPRPVRTLFVVLLLALLLLEEEEAPEDDAPCPWCCWVCPPAAREVDVVDVPLRSFFECRQAVVVVLLFPAVAGEGAVGCSRSDDDRSVDVAVITS
mmetsp:Transcript_28879/g.73037  ORF Transcript_28879/g.73037 Transcript_28879/m.73037 type:complete len:282 (-) Transcript_28879:1665-2510(-)